MVIWKEGMKVEVKAYCSHCHPGIVYTLITGIINGQLIASNKEGGCSCTGNWILVQDVIDWEERTKRGDLI
jgi:hypothetical protein